MNTSERFLYSWALYISLPIWQCLSVAKVMQPRGMAEDGEIVTESMTRRLGRTAGAFNSMDGLVLFTW